MIEVNEIRNGMTLIVEGGIYQVISFLHVKPGKGSAFVKTKMKNLRTGTTLDRTFNTNVKFEEARIDRNNVQYLYEAGGIYYFMDIETYNQLELSEEQIGENKPYLIENGIVNVVLYQGELLGITLPEKMEFTITRCDPAVKGNTASNVTKPAYTETGLLVRVPMFIEEGSKIIVTTEDGKYYGMA